MAPGFLSKFVKSGHAQNGSITRDRHDSSLDTNRSSSSSHTSSSSSSSGGRQRAISASGLPAPLSVHPIPPVPSIAREFSSTDSGPSTRPPSVTIVPPSPLVHQHEFSSSSNSSSHNLAHNLPTPTTPRQITEQPAAAPSSFLGMQNGNGNSIPRSRTISAPAPAPFVNINEDNLPTPNPTRSFTGFKLPAALSRPSSRNSNPKPPSRSVTPSSSSKDLKEQAKAQQQSPFDIMALGSNKPLEPPKEATRKASNKSLRQGTGGPGGLFTSHLRASTAPPPQLDPATAEVQIATYNEDGILMTPVVESPPSINTEFPTTSKSHVSYPYPSPASNYSSSPADVGVGASFNGLVPHTHDSDAVSVVSSNSKEKKRPWRRNTSSQQQPQPPQPQPPQQQRKPSGFASALAATGMAMANPGYAAAQQAQMSSVTASPMMAVDSLNGINGGGGDAGGRTYLSRSPANSSTNLKAQANGNGNKSTTSLHHRTSNSSKSRRSNTSPKPKKRRGSASAASGGAYSDGGATSAAEYYDNTGPDYYSGLEEGSSDEDDEFGFSGDDDDEDVERGGRSDRGQGGRMRRSPSGASASAVSAGDDGGDGFEGDDEDVGPNGSTGGLTTSVSAPGGLSGSGSALNVVEGGEGGVGARRRGGSVFADDIPVTGFAVASNKRNADFHDVFPNIPVGDYLIEDYGCALQREILIQGRIYISENHICFHANIFGWITDLSIPIYEITSLEKKMTAFVIPNAIQITTRQAKYTFASFLARDTTFDVIFNIWKLVRPEQALGGPVLTNTSNSVATSASASMSGSGLVTSPRGSLEGIAVVGGAGGKKVESRQPKVTQCRCGMEGKHFSELAIEMVFPGTPDRIHNLMFASGFMKDFMVVDQKLTDIQMSDWAPVTPGSTLLARNMSYIKPLNASLGPKQAKCEIRDETEYCDWEDYVSTVTTTRTPEVPSGGVFAVKTRCCIMWASRISTRVVVTTQVDWTGRSFIKGIIERSAIDGQKTYHGELERSMRAYIQEHIAEFVPEGVDPSALQETTTTAVPSTPAPGSNAQPSSSTASRSDPDAQRKQKEKQREHERNQRSLQWAWDTFDGAFGVAKQSAKGAIELIRDAWDQSSSTTILYFVIVFLVLSNVWTLVRVGSGGVVGGVGGLVGGGRGKDDEPVLVGGVGGGKGKVRGALGLNEEVERERKEWVHSVVTALWEELNHGGLKSLDPLASSTLSLSSASPVSSPSTPLMTGTPGDLEEWWKEVKELEKALETIEDRMKVLKESIGSVKVQQQHHDGHALVDEL